MPCRSPSYTCARVVYILAFTCRLSICTSNLFFLALTQRSFHLKFLYSICRTDICIIPIHRCSDRISDCTRSSIHIAPCIALIYSIEVDLLLFLGFGSAKILCIGRVFSVCILSLAAQFYVDFQLILRSYEHIRYYHIRRFHLFLFSPLEFLSFDSILFVSSHSAPLGIGRSSGSSKLVRTELTL